MIVISGALVVVALILLVFGIFDSELDFVYASIAVSGAAFVFLLIGIFQRRGETAEGKEGGTAPAVADDAARSTGVTTVIPSVTSSARESIPVADSDGAADSEASEGTVLVVADRPRYHVAGCRYLAGKEADELDVREARDEGFTPCGVCKPDANLVPVAAAVPLFDADEDLDDDVSADDDESEEQVEPLVPTRTAATRKAPVKPAGRPPATKAAPTRTTSRTAPVKAAPVTSAPTKKAPAAAAALAKTTPAKAAPAKAAPAKAAPAKAAPAKAVPTKAAPIKAAPAKVAAAKAAPAKRTAPTVVVIPDRGKFHTSECRYVRGVDGAEELTKAQATRQGYDACGVCKP